MKRLTIIIGMTLTLAAAGTAAELKGFVEDQACAGKPGMKDDAACAEVMQCPDVRAVIDAVRSERVRLAVAREKREPLAAEIALHYRAGGRAVRCFHGGPLGILQVRKVVQASAADDSQIDRHDQDSFRA